MSDLWIASMILLWIVVLVLGFLLAGALRELAILHLRLGEDPGALITDSGLDRGTAAPAFEAPDARSGEMVRLRDLEPRARVLVFMTPTCSACRDLVPHLNEVVRTRASEFDFLMVCHGDKVGCESFANTHGLLSRMLLDESGAITNDYQVQFTPFTYLLDYQNQVLMRGVANDWRQLESLLGQEGTFEAGRHWSAVTTDVGE